MDVTKPAMRPRRYWTDADDAALAKFVAERKWTVGDLAYMLDRQPAVIRKRLRRLGLTIRSSGEARRGMKFSIEARANMSAAAKRRWQEKPSEASRAALQGEQWQAYQAARWRTPPPGTEEYRTYRKFREHMGAKAAKSMLGLAQPAIPVVS